MAVYSELNIDQGTSFSSVITVNDDDTGDPINLATYNAKSQIRSSYYTQNPTAEFICTMSDSANGNVQISLPASVTSNITPGRYVYDLVINTANNDIVIRVVEGTVTINPGVTR